MYSLHPGLQNILSLNLMCQTFKNVSLIKESYLHTTRFRWKYGHIWSLTN